MTVVHVVVKTVCITQTMFSIPETMVPAIETGVSRIETMVFVVETTVGVTQTLLSEAEPIFYASETGFSIAEKIVGEVPAAFVHPIGFSGGHNRSLVPIPGLFCERAGKYHFSRMPGIRCLSAL
jgi:hypothetical protein